MKQEFFRLQNQWSHIHVLLNNRNQSSEPLYLSLQLRSRALFGEAQGLYRREELVRQHVTGPE